MSARSSRSRQVPPDTAWAATGGTSGGSLIVGLGAAAGGAEAFRTFFEHMPADAGMAFVLVQHLDPAEASTLANLIGGSTAMPVVTATDGVLVEPNRVYVIPPDTVPTVADRRLHLLRPPTGAARHNTVDLFLSSLAEDVGEDAVGVVLSAFGDDGMHGIAAIKEGGGLTLGQAGTDDHAVPGAPPHATAGSLVDHLLPPAAMPALLLEYGRHRAMGRTGALPDLVAALPAICAVLHTRLGRDFARYKPGTLVRRIGRRMSVLQVDDPARYAELLLRHPHEAELLFRELLIGVTRFFRDPAVFDALLASVLGPLAAEPGRADPVRVWVVGCATGEEVYTLALLLREAMARGGQHRAIQVFGTDIDDRAIEVARAGLYPASIAKDMTPRRLEQNFILEEGRYRVSRELREMCLFSVHDVVSDPPFSRLDLVSCRNLMIYFEGELQQRVLATLHYALRSPGHLLLGPSEGVTTQSRLFAPIDRRSRIYLRQDTAARLPAYSLDRPATDLPLPPSRPGPNETEIERRAMRALAAHGPSFLVINRHQDVVRFSVGMAGLLQPAAGQASLHLFALLHPDLRAPVRTVLRQLARHEARVRQDGVGFDVNGRRFTVGVIAEPLPGPEDEGLVVVAFQDQGTRAAGAATPARTGTGTQALEAELAVTQERLRAALDELEAANEERRSSSEEFIAINEELQSANEELETSKEELQSLNEELQTINTELNQRNESLVRSNSDLANLFDSTSIATLFLDSELRIRRFTPRLQDIFKVRDGDEGRPITDIVTLLTQDGLGGTVREVMRTLQPVEREVAVPQRGTSYFMQVRPYRDVNNVVDGAVVTFVEVSGRKRDEPA